VEQKKQDEKVMELVFEQNAKVMELIMEQNAKIRELEEVLKAHGIMPSKN